MSMELFRTVIPCEPMHLPISHDDTILMLGSCFTENIGTFLEDNLFNIVINPTGTLFNPVSLAAALIRVCEGTPYKEEDLFFHENVWRSFDHHSRFSSGDKKGTLHLINDQLDRARKVIENIDVLAITLGTAFIYKLKENGRVVSNCHKLPGSSFIRELAPMEMIVNSLRNAIDALIRKRPQLRIIFTISPVRHLRDNPHENTVSKAYLAAALHQLMSDLASVYYFPSYEILIDELRDYRFYASDMAHPSEVAVKYICDRFSQSCLSEKAASFIKEFEAVRKTMSHRRGNTVEGQQSRIEFVKKRLTILHETYPSISLDKAYSWVAENDNR